MQKLLYLFFLLFSLHSLAQNKPISYLQQSWVSWSPQVKFSKHWGSWADAEIHTSDHYFNGFSQAVFRLAATYYNSRGNKFTAGLGYTDYLPGDNHKYISIPEYFTWEQYQWFSVSNKQKLMQWLRLEQKFRQDVINDYTAADTHTTTYKFRYNFFYTYSLHKQGLVPKAFSLALGEELYLYYAPHNHNHLFDQNRFFLGFSYAVNAHDNLVFGVLNIIQENGAGTAYTDNNVFRLSLYQNIGL